jgi:DNA-binding LacI/PurR family transcriptional regulator
MQLKRPSAKDVAARAGVSPTTVSFVLNDRPGAAISQATRARVRSAAAELGYQPHASARGLAAGRSHILGLVLRQSPEQVAEDALLAETIRGLSSAAQAAGYRVLVEPLSYRDGDDAAGYASLLRSRGTDGLVVSGPRIEDRELAALARDGAPIVIQGALPGSDIPSVDVDNVAAAAVAVGHLVALGHRVIGCITNAPFNYTAARERREGYRQAIREAGLAADERLVVEANFDAASGRRAMARLLEQPDLTAVFVASDVVALGALAAIREAGLRVPEDVSVVGFDDVPLAAFFDPPLTTIRLPAEDLGRAAGLALLDRIAGRVVATRTILPTELVIRSSSGPPPASDRRRRGVPEGG